MSVRRLERHLDASFGQLPPGWSCVLQACCAQPMAWRRTFRPAKRLLPPLHHSKPGSVYSMLSVMQGASYDYYVLLPATADISWPVGVLALDAVVALCDDHIAYGSCV